MGGGDLNTKKAWHPNNYKNQERVWKAEQAAAQEKKRISELQRERAEERDREELNEVAKRTAGGGCSPNDNRLHWMYDKPDKKVHQEDYLLGKSIDTNERTDKDNQDVIPAVARRVVGSSMTAMSSDTQVDLVRKLREDPLLLIKERERAARAALLNNPLQRRRLTELLRKEQDQSKMKKDEKKSKKKHSELDNILAEKLNALGANKGVDLKTLLASDDDSSSDSSSDQSKHKKKKKDKKKRKNKSKKEHKKKKNSDSDDSEVEIKESKKDSRYAKKRDKDCKLEQPQNKRKPDREHDYEKERTKKHRRDMSPDRKYSRDKHRDSSEEDFRRSAKQSTSSRERNDRAPKEKQDTRSKRRTGMSEEEKAAKLAEMAAAGAEREVQRGRRVAEQLAEKEAPETKSNVPRSSRHEARALPDSLESRIHSNRHYIQRDRRHMDEHFARR